MPARESRTELLVGIFILFGLAVLGWLIISFGNFSKGYKDGYHVTVRFSDASNVIKGTKVRMAGTTIGEVASPPSLEELQVGANEMPKVRVPLVIDNQRRLPRNTVFQIESLTVLGDKVIVASIPENPSTALLEEGEIVDGGGASGLESIQSDAVAVASDIRELVEDSQTSLIKFDAALDDIRAIALRLTESIEQVNNGILSDRNIGTISRTLTNIEDASVGAKAASADMQPLLADARLAVQEITALADRAQLTFGEVDKQLAHIGPAMEEVPSTVRSIKAVADDAQGAVQEAEKTLAKAGDTLDNLNSENGLVSALGKDEDISTDTKTFVRNLRRYGILGYKDEATPEDDPRERYRGRRR